MDEKIKVNNEKQLFFESEHQENNFFLRKTQVFGVRRPGKPTFP